MVTRAVSASIVALIVATSEAIWSRNSPLRVVIAFEIGYEQAEDIKKLAIKYLGEVNVEVKKDLSFKNRMLFVYN